MKVTIKNLCVLLFLLIVILTSCQTGKNKGKIWLPDKELTAIAIAPDATEREKKSANEIVEYLYKITDKKIPVKIISGKAIPDGIIAVGKLAISAGIISEDELSKVASDGYAIKINKTGGAICGYRDLGTLYGAYAFLRQSGVNFYSKDCEIINKNENLRIAETSSFVKPHFEMRALFKLDVYFKGMVPDPKLGYTPYDDMGYPGDLGAPEERNWVHSASFLMPYRLFGKDHPEFFAMQKDGSRYKPGIGPPGHLCLSNEEMKKAGAERLLFLIDKQKERTFFVVTQGDGRSNSWCQCNLCRSLDAIAGDHMTDRLLEYVNYNARIVAKNYPGKKILTLAYTEATSRPPQRLMPEPNVMIMYCPYPPQTNCQSHDLNCPQNEVGLQELKGWIAKCPDNMYIFDYPRGYSSWYEPFGSFYATMDKLKFYSENGIKGIIQCVVPTSFTDLFIFVQGRLLWNPKADVESLIDEFFKAYYGPAAEYMREYFNFMHSEIKNRPVHQMCEGSNPELVTGQYADKALSILTKAQNSVTGDQIKLKRIDLEKFCVLWSDIDQRNTVKNNLETTLDEHIKRLGETVRIAWDMQLIQVSRKHNFKNWIREVAPLWIQAEPWYYDPAVNVFLANPENLFKL